MKKMLKSFLGYLVVFCLIFWVSNLLPSHRDFLPTPEWLDDAVLCAFLLAVLPRILKDFYLSVVEDVANRTAYKVHQLQNHLLDPEKLAEDIGYPVAEDDRDYTVDEDDL